MTAALALALLGPATFGGGSPSALAATIADATRNPVVMAPFDNRPIESFEFEPSDLEAMAQAIRRHAKLWQAPGTLLAYHPGTLPRHLFGIVPIRGDRPSGFLFTGPPPGAIKEGKITLRTKGGEAVTMGSLDTAGFGKDVFAQWMFADFPLVVDVRDLDTLQFLQHIARAIGAKLTQTKDHFHFSLDPQEFRLRARRTYQEFGTPEALKDLGPIDRSDFDLSLAALNAATNAQITEAFGKPDGSTKILAGGAIRGLVERRWRAKVSAAEEMRSQDVRISGQRLEPTPSPETLRSVDPRAQATVILRADFRVDVEMPTRDALGNPGPPIRF